MHTFRFGSPYYIVGIVYIASKWVTGYNTHVESKNYWPFVLQPHVSFRIAAIATGFPHQI